MGDLYTGLINPKMRKGLNGGKYWGAFDSLNKQKIPTSTDLLAIQVEKLRLLESSDQKQYVEANKFLAATQSKIGQNDQVNNAIYDQAYNRIIELFNAGLRGSSVNPYRNVATKGLTEQQIRNNAQSEISKVLQELTLLLQQIKISPQLSKQMITTLNNRLQTFDWKSNTPHSYIMEKADLIEALMVERINQHPGMRAIVTGAWRDELGQQLIEDAFAFNTENISMAFQGGALNFSITTSKGKETKSASSIKDFLTQLDELSGTKFSISLSNDLYNALREGAALAGQAKSGLQGQAILNKAARNSLSLEEVDFNPRALWDLYNLDLQTRTEYFKPESKQNSKTLEALANYCLSKNIAKTALSRNQVYLTADGFITASQWMERYQRYLIFSPGVRTVGGDFLTRQRKYYFNKN